MRGISLFASSGIGEFYLTNSNIDIVVANELLPKRAELYRKIYPESKMITGDITNEDVKPIVQKVVGQYEEDDVNVVIGKIR